MDVVEEVMAEVRRVGRSRMEVRRSMLRERRRAVRRRARRGLSEESVGGRRL